MIQFFINKLRNLFLLRSFGMARSADWYSFRANFLREHSSCAVCGKDSHLEVHHIVPFHIAPGRELDMTNLITLCPDHHFWIGHLGSWRSYNQTVLEDAANWRDKISNRP